MERRTPTTNRRSGTGRSPEPMSTSIQATVHPTTQPPPPPQRTPDYWDQKISADRGWASANSTHSLGSSQRSIPTTQPAAGVPTQQQQSTPVPQSNNNTPHTSVVSTNHPQQQQQNSSSPTTAPNAAVDANLKEVRASLQNFFLSKGVRNVEGLVENLIADLERRASSQQMIITPPNNTNYVNVMSNNGISTPEASFDGRSTIVDEVSLACTQGNGQVDIAAAVERPRAPAFAPNHPKAHKPKPGKKGPIHIDPEAPAAALSLRNTISRHHRSAFAYSRSSGGGSNYSSYSDTASTMTSNSAAPHV
eukprot:PhF_6_TR15691/c1_g1_i1/m.24411